MDSYNNLHLLGCSKSGQNEGKVFILSICAADMYSLLLHLEVNTDKEVTHVQSLCVGQ